MKKIFKIIAIIILIIGVCIIGIRGVNYYKITIDLKSNGYEKVSTNYNKEVQYDDNDFMVDVVPHFFSGNTRVIVNRLNITEDEKEAQSEIRTINLRKGESALVRFTDMNYCYVDIQGSEITLTDDNTLVCYDRSEILQDVGSYKEFSDVLNQEFSKEELENIEVK